VNAIKLFLGSDHAGYALKERLKQQLTEAGHAVEDLGVFSEARADYPDQAKAVAEQVASHPATRGLLVCGSGIGMAIAANKIAGIRAAVACGEETARLSRAHNDANILCLGARTTAPELAWSALKMFLATPFEGGRHADRVAKIGEMEKRGVRG
jgi:RpiB/LacA/LacB family sugar-phosphate isomerase